jgi:protein-S-isoprenylcysteine O-methyltransferase Ste14
MYIGAGLALSGAALYCHSFVLLVYTGVLFLAVHLFVIGYEEPTLRRTFGQEYDVYCRNTRRWWPTFTDRARAGAPDHPPTQRGH